MERFFKQLIKKYNDNSNAPFESKIRLCSEWYDFEYTGKNVAFSMLINSSLSPSDYKALEKGVIAFCDTIHDKSEGHLIEKKKSKKLARCENPSIKDDEYINEEFRYDGSFDERLEVFNHLTQTYKLYYENNDIYIIIFSEEFTEFWLDETILNEAFRNFCEAYFREFDIVTV